jgi:hypothetical protein
MTRKARLTDARQDGTDVQRYEQLRSGGLDGEPSGFRLGQALLERRSVAAWARAWSETQAERPAAGPETPTVPTRAALSDELVGALASMALARVAAG